MKTDYTGLRAQVDSRRRSVQELWRDLEADRKRVEQKAAPDAADVARLEQKYEQYRTEARALDADRDRLISELAAVAAAGNQAGHGRLGGLGAEFVKRMGTEGQKALDGTSGGTLVPAFFDPGIRELPQRRLFVRSLLPVRQATGDKVHYLRQSVATNAAAPVAAGGLKPTSVFTVERVEETVRTIAHVTEALDRGLLSDYDALVDFLDNQLRLGVLLAEEQQILSGSGTAPNLRGILNTAGISTVARGGTEPRVEAVHRAITAVRAAFFEPDAVVLHPNDWQDVLFEKDANGHFLAAEVTEADPGTLWGKTIVTSPVIAEGTGLVGAFAVGATVFDREEARISFTETGLGDAPGVELFSRNQIRFRGEERIAFGVERPAAFCSVTNL